VGKGRQILYELLTSLLAFRCQLHEMLAIDKVLLRELFYEFPEGIHLTANGYNFLTNRIALLIIQTTTV
jgi:hypothetical protein